MKRFKLVTSIILILLIVFAGVLFFSAWRMAEEASGVTYWQAFEVGENGEVLFYGEPESVWVEEYTVWDVLGAYFRHIAGSRSLGELFGPVLLDESTYMYEY